jgi:electron transfer flavoprotein beta subunit
MNILVCIKQVPDTNEIKMDPETNTLIRAGVPSIVNTYDQFALEVAVRLKEREGDVKVVVVSMGPPQADEALRTCLAKGADAAYLVTDRAFSGSDTLATSYILTKALPIIEAEQGKFELIFCGKQAIDGDTAQVGPEMAEWLDYPQVTYAVDVHLNEGRIEVGYDIIETAIPAVVTVTKPGFESRIPSVSARLKAKDANVTMLTAAQVHCEAKWIGLKGSPTKVKKIFTPVMDKNGIRIQENTAVDSAVKLARLLSEAKLLKEV